MNWLLTNYKIQYIIQGNTIVEMLENIKNKIIISEKCN